MICDENEENNLSQQIVESGVKSRKISILKEFLRHDKNTICLPRQCLRDGAKALSLLGSLDGNVEFTPYLHLWKIGLEKLK